MIIFPKLPYQCIRTVGLFFPGNITILLGLWEISDISPNLATILALKPLISPFLSHIPLISSLEFLIFPETAQRILIIFYYANPTASPFTL